MKRNNLRKVKWGKHFDNFGYFHQWINPHMQEPHAMVEREDGTVINVSYTCICFLPDPIVYKNPIPAVDIIIELPNDKIVLIERKNPPLGWALPGGFVDEGESLENAAVREAKEETDLDVILIKQLHTYSDPKRDPRKHIISTVFIAKADGIPTGKDDAKVAKAFSKCDIPYDKLVFDHKKILGDYILNNFGFILNNK